MKTKVLKKASDNAILLYSMAFLVVGFGAFFWLLFYHKSLIHFDDGFDLWYPQLVYIKNTCTSLFANCGFWSWNAGLGGNAIANFAVFLDPFNYLAAAFPFRFLEIGYGVAEYARIYCAGLAMLAFLRYRSFSVRKSVLGGISYAFSAFVLWNIIHPCFLVPIILFPLVILGIERVDRERKYLVLILSVAASLITSVYFSYMTAAFAALYFFISFFFSDKRKTISGFLSRLFRTFLGVFLGLLISMPVTVSAVWGLMQSNTDSSIVIALFHSIKQYILFVPDLFSGAQLFGNYSASAVGGLFIVSIPAMFLALRDKKDRPQIIVFFITVLCLLFPKLSSVLNGFSYPTGRWCYALSFFFIWAGLSALEHIDFHDEQVRGKYKRSLTICGLVFLITMMLSIVFNFMDRIYCAVIVLTVCACSVSVSVICSKNERIIRRQEQILLAVTMVNIICAWLIIFNPFSGSYFNSFLAGGQTGRVYNTSLLMETINIHDNDFYRVDYAEKLERDGRRSIIKGGSLPNEGIFTDTWTVRTYLSTTDTDRGLFDRALCNNGNYYSRVKILGNDGRSRMNFLLGVRYFIATQNAAQYRSYGFSYWGSGNYGDIYENNYAASLGYVYPFVIRESDFDRYFYTDREQILMQAAVVSDDYDGSTPEIEQANIITDTVDLGFEVLETNGVDIQNGSIRVEEPNSSVRIRVSDFENSELYIYFENLRRIPVSYDEYMQETLGDNPARVTRDAFVLSNLTYTGYGNFTINVYGTAISGQIRNNEGQNNQAISGVRDHMSNLGYYETAADLIMTVVFPNPGTYTYDSLRFLAVSQEHFDEQALQLETNRLAVQEIGRDYVRGEIVSDGGILFLSILDDSGWDVYIDGDRVEEIIKTNIGFIGVDVSPGEHMIELRYEPIYFRPSCIMCVAGICLTLGIMIISIRYSRKRVQQGIESHDQF